MGKLWVVMTTSCAIRTLCYYNNTRQLSCFTSTQKASETSNPEERECPINLKQEVGDDRACKQSQIRQMTDSSK